MPRLEAGITDCTKPFCKLGTTLSMVDSSNDFRGQGSCKQGRSTGTLSSSDENIIYVR